MSNSKESILDEGYGAFEESRPNESPYESCLSEHSGRWGWADGFAKARETETEEIFAQGYLAYQKGNDIREVPFDYDDYVPLGAYAPECVWKSGWKKGFAERVNKQRGLFMDEIKKALKIILATEKEYRRLREIYAYGGPISTGLGWFQAKSRLKVLEAKRREAKILLESMYLWLGNLDENDACFNKCHRPADAHL